MSEENQIEDESTGQKSISLAPSLTALFQPSAEYLGEKLKDYIKDALEKKKKDNFQAHCLEVNKLLGSQVENNSIEDYSVRQLDLFNRWQEDVGDVDPADAELSMLWENLLADSLLGSDIDKEIYDVLKELTPREARVLLDLKSTSKIVPMMSGKINRRDRYSLNKLLDKGLVEKDYFFATFTVSVSIFAMVCLYYIAPPLSIFTQLEINYLTVSATVLALLVLLYGIGFRYGFARWSYTWLGEKLVGLSIR